MPSVTLAGIACIVVLLGYGKAVPDAQDSAQLASNGVVLGALVGAVYYYRDQLTKRLDRIERRLDSIMQDLFGRLKS